MEFQGKFYIKKHTLFFVFIFVFFIFAFDSVSPVWAGGLFLSEKKDVYKRYLLRTNFERHHEDYDDETFTTGVFSLNGHGPRPVPCCSRNIS